MSLFRGATHLRTTAQGGTAAPEKGTGITLGDQGGP